MPGSIRAACAILLSALLAAASLVVVPPTAAAAQPMRWELGPSHPMFQYVTDDTRDKVLSPTAVWNALDPALRDNSVLVFEPRVTNGAIDYGRLKTVMDEAERAGIAFMLQTATWDYFNSSTGLWKNRSPRLTGDDLRSYFRTYDKLVGLQQVEVTTGYPLSNRKAYLIENIRIAAEFNAHFFYKDQSYYRTNSGYARVGEDAELLDVVRQHKNNVSFMYKQNGHSQHYTNAAFPLGYWLAGITSNWGVNGENWMYYEAGYNTLGAEANKQGGHSVANWKAPEALWAQTMLMAAANGATIYSYEDLATSTAYEGRVSPAYQNVLKQVQKRLIADKLIPTRDEMRDRIKVAYHQDRPFDSIPELAQQYGTRLFRDLYGPSAEEIAQYDTIGGGHTIDGVGGGRATNWFPRSGRYALLPLLPMHATAEERANLQNVINHDDWTGRFGNGDPAKVRAYFDSLYKQSSSGTAWAQRSGSNWYLMNPSENRRGTADFDLALSAGGARSVKGALEEHTAAYVKETPSQLKVFVNNYRVDKQVLDSQVRVSQEVTVPASGTYTAGAWIAAADSSATLDVRINGGKRTFVNVPRRTAYTSYTIPSLKLNAGDRVEIAVRGAWADWVNVDDVWLTAEGSSTNLVTNPGFEDSKQAWHFPMDSDNLSGTYNNNPRNGSRHAFLNPGPTAYGWGDDRASKPFDQHAYMTDYFLTRPDTSERRTASFTVAGVQGKKPSLSSTAGANYTHTVKWNRKAKEYRIDISLNGYAEFTIRLAPAKGKSHIDCPKGRTWAHDDQPRRRSDG